MMMFAGVAHKMGKSEFDSFTAREFQAGPMLAWLFARSFGYSLL